MLTSEKVTEMFLDCFFTEEELNGATEPPENVVKIKGITCFVGFHPDRLESYREDVKKCLQELPFQFHTETGGVFPCMCETKDGVLWTGYQKVMEQLCILAIGLNLGEFFLQDVLGSFLYFKVKI